MRKDRIVSNRKRDCHITVLVEGTQEEFDAVIKDIQKLVRKNNSPDAERTMSYEGIRLANMPKEKKEKGFTVEYKFGEIQKLLRGEGK